ncbi:DUF2254 domain-containing protein [uncultured Piscinibacter sp.]|uniref:DUF2254 domain-containing protein n=1 Tax=uncultured Piscinibacter sp. TaxID=1131835 RepID=UPI00261B9A76|nr:DUF2254 domain-containing protein [uncultured Piscinibacter sp.]
MPDLNRIRLLWGRVRQTLWWRPAVWSAAAVGAAFASALADLWVPSDWLPPFQTEVVDDLLRIMASSMLAVSTFSLSVLVNAYASAANAGTPSATRLVVAEPRSQKAVAVFLAAFIFSIVGFIALGTGRYGAPGRMALFMCTLGVLAWVVVSFMSYIDVLTRIGRVSHTIETVERATGKTLGRYARAPLSGARAAAEPPAGAKPVRSTLTGHVQFVDVDALQALAEGCDGQVHVSASPGDLVHPMSPLAWLLTMADDDGRDALETGVRKAFVIGAERTIEQDAAYGLIMLAEIAQRALSPAVNDPGTAIAVLGSQTRLLVQTFSAPEDADAKVRDRVTAAPASPAALVAIAYEPIARCSAEQFDVMRQLLRHLDALVHNAPPAVAKAAQELVQRTLARAARAGIDAADLSHWDQEARALGLAPTSQLTLHLEETAAPRS